jgi:hypothetical protein
VTGITVEIAKLFFNQDISIQVRRASLYYFSKLIQLSRKEQRGSFQFVVMKVHFDNVEIDIDRRLREKSSSLNEYMPVESVGFLRMFPFFIAFNKKLEIRLTGDNLMIVMPNLSGQQLNEHFDLQRPAVTLTWEGVFVNTTETVYVYICCRLWHISIACFKWSHYSLYKSVNRRKQSRLK